MTITDSGWRDEYSAWFGAIYITGPQAEQKSDLCAFVFDYHVSTSEISDRIKLCLQRGVISQSTYIYVLMDTDQVFDSKPTEIIGLTVHLRSKQQLLLSSGNLRPYARSILDRFRKETVGGTDRTLENTFVQPRVRRGDETESRSLASVLTEWSSTGGRRQLAIVGEFGQGKSTAMLQLCVELADKFLRAEATSARVPLLIELRGRSPSEMSPSEFLHNWGQRYSLSGQFLMNMIMAGQALLIFEGFDELRNAGREYNRHEHFNALWQLAYPGTKVIFTGRPNFFLDDTERNRTLRVDQGRGAGGSAYTEVWRLEFLSKDEIAHALRTFSPEIRRGIGDAISADTDFFDIASRPSMLPVIATIWSDIEELARISGRLSNAVLVERYLETIYERKEEEIRRDQQRLGHPQDASYLILPRAVKEFFTLGVVFWMVGNNYRNTIERREFNRVVSQLYDHVHVVFQSAAAAPYLAGEMRRFQERFDNEPRSEVVERIATEVATTGLFTPDPAGRLSALRLPHKQYYEHLISKLVWQLTEYEDATACKAIRTLRTREKGPWRLLWSEDNAASFFADLLPYDRFSSLFTIPFIHRISFYVGANVYASILRVLDFFRIRPSSVARGRLAVPFSVVFGVAIVSCFVASFLAWVTLGMFSDYLRGFGSLTFLVFLLMVFLVFSRLTTAERGMVALLFIWNLLYLFRFRGLRRPRPANRPPRLFRHKLLRWWFRDIDQMRKMVDAEIVSREVRAVGMNREVSPYLLERHKPPA